MIDGSITLATIIDTSGSDAALSQLTDKISKSADEAARRSAEYSDAANAGMRAAEAVIDANIEGLTQLAGKYGELMKQREQSDGKSGKTDPALEREIEATNKLAEMRQKAGHEALQISQQLKRYNKGVDDGTKSVNDNVSAHMSLRMQLREMKMRLIEMEMAGQRGTKAYRELQERIAKLTDALGDAQAQATILANDQRGFAGIMSGLSGLSGAFSAATGALSLFGTENEELQKTMMRLQAVMSITMGLQQVQQTLNKDSAFSLVTLNGLKEWWAKITAAATATTAAETAATTAETAATEANTAAKAQNAVANQTDAAAVQANTAAKAVNAEVEVEGAAASKANNISKKESITLTNIDTAGKGANAAASTAGAAANFTLAGAFKMVGAAIKSIPVFGWIAAAIGILIGVITHLVNKSKELAKAAKEKNEMLRESRKVYYEATAQIEDYKSKLENFNGTQEQEKKLVSELNSKYGEHMGYCKTVAQWKEQLAKKGEAYCEMLMLEAEAQAILTKATEAYINTLEVAERAKAGEYDDNWWEFWNWGGKSSADKRVDAKRDAEAEFKKWQEELKKKRSEIAGFKSENGLDFHPDTTQSGSSSTYDPKKAKEQVFQAWEAYKKTYTEAVRAVNDEIRAVNIEYMNDGLKKDLAQSRANFDKLQRDWNERFLDLGRAMKQATHDAFMAGQNATEEAWRNSADGKKTEREYLAEIFAANQDLERQYTEQRTQYQQQAQREELRITDSYHNALIDRYGTFAQRREKLMREYTTALNAEGADEYFDNIVKTFEKAFADLDIEELKDSLDWDKLFADLGTKSADALNKVKDKLLEFIKANKDLDPSALKEISDAVLAIDDSLRQRDPFGALSRDLKALKDAAKEAADAQKAYNNAADDAAKAAAKVKLEEAKKAQRNAEAAVTASLQAATNQAKELLNVATAITGAFEAVGTELPSQLTGFISGMAGVMDGLGSIDLTKPLSVISGAAKAIGGFASAIGSLFNNDAGHEKRIQSLQKNIDSLQRSYDDLGEAIDAAFSTDAAKGIEQQNALIEQQQALIRKQIAEEEAKKKTDKDRITEWEQQLEDLDKQIQENKEKAVDAIFGEDIQSAITAFADAWADAWADGTSRAETARDTVRDMMKQMVRESIKAAIQSSGAMEQIREQLQQFYADSILSDWEQDYIYQMAEQLQSDLDRQFGWASSLLSDSGSSTTQSGGTGGGFATASQDSVDELNGRFAAMHTSLELGRQTLDQMLETSIATREQLTQQNRIGEEMRTMQLAAVGHLESINRNTRQLYEMNERLARIERNTESL